MTPRDIGRDHQVPKGWRRSTGLDHNNMAGWDGDDWKHTVNGEYTEDEELENELNI